MFFFLRDGRVCPRQLMVYEELTCGFAQRAGNKRLTTAKHRNRKKKRQYRS